MAHTVDYTKVADRVLAIAQTERFHLLEALAKRTAETILARFSVRRVRVRIAKQNLGWTTGGRAVIEVTRERTP